MNDSELKKHIERARIRLMTGQPFFGSLIMKLPLVERNDFDTCATDGVKIYYNREFVSNLPVDEFAGVLAHEIAHVAFKHTLRRGERDPHDWNVACDYAINPICKKSGCALPASAMLEPKFSGMSVEDIYKIIHMEKPPKGEGEGEGESEGGGDNSQSGDNGLSDGGDPGGCGGVIDAPKIADGDKPKSGKVVGTKDLNGNVPVQAVDDLDIRQADMAERLSGNSKGGITGEIDELLKPQQDWRSLLRDFMQPARDDWSYRRFNRRNSLDDVLLPSPDGEETGELVLAVDTSGSVSDEQLQQSASEIQAIADDTRPRKITVIYNDYGDVNEDCVHEFEQGEDLTFKYSGRGGTCLKPAFEYVAKKGIRPDCFIYITDLYVSSNDIPSTVPDYPVVWLSCGDKSLPQGSPDIGEVIHAHDMVDM